MSSDTNLLKAADDALLKAIAAAAERIEGKTDPSTDTSGLRNLAEAYSFVVKADRRD